MPTNLPLDLSTVSAAELATLVAYARAQVPTKKPRATKKASAGKSKPCVRLSPHTGACTQCGAPGGAQVCETIASVALVADYDVRKYMQGRGEAPAMARLRRKYAR